MPAINRYVAACIAPALLFAGTADAAATRSVNVRTTGVGQNSVCMAKIDAQGRSLVTPWQRANCANLARLENSNPGVVAAVSEKASGSGFLGMGGAAPFGAGAVVAAGAGIGIGAGGNNSPGG